MNLTSKSRYALKIMMDLAYYGASDRLVRRHEMSARQGIPSDYLDQIMIKLRAGRLVKSTRGRSGGYRLSRHADDISMWDLFTAVEETIVPVECITSGHACDFERSCSSKDAWSRIFSSLRQSLSAISLGQLARQWATESSGPRATEMRVLEMSGDGDLVQECRSGGQFKGSVRMDRRRSEVSQGAHING
jgi:Rrf2 family iron-sulfur cluster assembly transcriptional regulator